MRVQEERQDNLLRLRVAEKALVSRPRWDDVPALGRGEPDLVALDLKDVDFVSSLFLQGCVDLSRELARRGGRLVLVNLSPHHSRMLGVIEGAEKLLVLEGEEQLSDRLSAGAGQRPTGAPDQGVTGAEKRVLWR